VYIFFVPVCKLFQPHIFYLSYRCSLIHTSLELSAKEIDMTVITYANGTFHYNTINGQLHREDGPAAEWVCGDRIWYLNGQLHRVDGPAVEYADGTKEWYLNDERHRVDGPAIERTDGYKAWFVDDQLHRRGGPAVEYPDGRKEYWVNDIQQDPPG
jgi:hypothetical protein